MTAVGKTDPAKRSPAQAEVLRIGATRIGYWTNRSESAVYQWLRRRPADCPIPPNLLPRVVSGAAEDGVDIDVALLWPASAGLIKAGAAA